MSAPECWCEFCDWEGEYADVNDDMECPHCHQCVLPIAERWPTEPAQANNEVTT